MTTDAFWKSKTLQQMSAEEWESLCDGCAKCCLHKLEDEDTGIIYYTNIACRLLDTQACQCRDYPRRATLIRDCVLLDVNNPDFAETLHSMPPSCAYRLIAQGQDLPGWHPLISGDKQSVHKAGQSVQGKTVTEENVEDYEDHIVDWPLEYL